MLVEVLVGAELGKIEVATVVLLVGWVLKVLGVVVPVIELRDVVALLVDVDEVEVRLREDVVVLVTDMLRLPLSTCNAGEENPMMETDSLSSVKDWSNARETSPVFCICVTFSWIFCPSSRQSPEQGTSTA